MVPGELTPDVVTAPARPGGDTVYFCAVDGAGNACSFINSNYMGFGSGRQDTLECAVCEARCCLRTHSGSITSGFTFTAMYAGSMRTLIGLQGSLQLASCN